MKNRNTKSCVLFIIKLYIEHCYLNRTHCQKVLYDHLNCDTTNICTTYIINAYSDDPLVSCVSQILYCMMKVMVVYCNVLERTLLNSVF